MKPTFLEEHVAFALTVKELLVLYFFLSFQLTLLLGTEKVLYGIETITAEFKLIFLYDYILGLVFKGEKYDVNFLCSLIYTLSILNQHCCKSS